jgi:hypothetical protein
LGGEVSPNEDEGRSLKSSGQTSPPGPLTETERG